MGRFYWEVKDENAAARKRKGAADSLIHFLRTGVSIFTLVFVLSVSSSYVTDFLSGLPADLRMSMSRLTALIWP